MKWHLTLPMANRRFPRKLQKVCFRSFTTVFEKLLEKTLNGSHVNTHTIFGTTKTIDVTKKAPKGNGHVATQRIRAGNLVSTRDPIYKRLKDTTLVAPARVQAFRPIEGVPLFPDMTRVNLPTFFFFSPAFLSAPPRAFMAQFLARATRRSIFILSLMTHRGRFRNNDDIIG